MPQKTFAGGLALQSSMQHTWLVVALLCLLSASDNAAPAVSFGRAVGEMFRDALLISDGEGPEMVVLPTGRFASPRCQPGRTGARPVRVFGQAV